MMRVVPFHVCAGVFCMSISIRLASSRNIYIYRGHNSTVSSRNIEFNMHLLVDTTVFDSAAWYIPDITIVVSFVPAKQGAFKSHVL